MKFKALHSKITEGNILIAEFMGWRKGANCYPFTKKQRSGWGLQYHNSWDWLMPVVEKIESMGFEFAICQIEVAIMNDYRSLPESLRTSDLPMEKQFETIIKKPEKIEAVYSAIIQFLEWHNPLPLEV